MGAIIPLVFSGVGSLLASKGKSQGALQRSNAAQSIFQSQQFYDQFLSQFVSPSKANQDMFWDVAMGYAEDVPGIVNQGADRQLLGVDRMVSAGRSDILDAGSNLGADIDQVMASSGLYGSTAHTGAQTGVSAGTSRALNSLYAQGAAQGSAIEGGRIQGLANANTNLANLASGRSAQELGFLGTQLSAAMKSPIFAQSGGPRPGQAALSSLFTNLGSTGGGGGSLC